MEKRGTEIANVSQQVRPNVRPRFLSPEEIIARRRVTFGPNQRKAGVTEGTYKVTCDGCRGAGTVKFGTRPAEYCPKCGGVGELIVRGERHGDKLAPMWRDMKDTIFFLAVASILTAIFVAILLWRANAL